MCCASLGDFLGDPDKYNKSIMYIYFDMLDSGFFLE